MTHIAMALVFVWACGFAAFVSALPQPRSLGAKQADGVVALTGGGGTRIEQAMTLLTEGKAQRLLISGVHPNALPDDILKLSQGDGDLFDCCVDLGRKASNTAGNATETAAWAADHGFQSIIVVTSDYHMPRSLAVLRAELPDTILTPYPVRASWRDGWWTRPFAWKTLTVEYTKYIAIAGRELIREAGLA